MPYKRWLYSQQKNIKLEMWADAQRDGRPAEYRWLPLFNADIWLTPTSRVPCSNAAKARNPLKFAGVPKLTKRYQPLVGRRSPYCKDVWRRYWCLTSFFFRLSIHALIAKIYPTKLCDGAQIAIFCIIFASCISSEPRAAHFRPAF